MVGKLGSKKQKRLDVTLSSEISFSSSSTLFSEANKTEEIVKLKEEDDDLRSGVRLNDLHFPLC